MSGKMLWTKESELPNALYVDLFKEAKSSQFYRDATIEVSKHARKDNELSLKYRQEGNIAFQQNNIKKAMELYNKTLCFAETGSEYLSLAYANRGSCFMKLKMFQKCLSDIELAEKAHYPEELMPKLEKRKTDCLNQLKKAVNRKVIKPILSFQPDENIPSMANTLKIMQNEKFGRHIVAQCDIEEDKTVLIEEPMFKLLSAAEYKKCLVCLKENENLIPCTNCTNAMFCSGVCSSNEFHKYECTMKKIMYFEGANGINVRSSVRFAMEAVLNLLNNFSSTDDMIRFADGCTEESRNDPIEIAVTDWTAKSNFKTFMKLHYIKSNEETFAIYIIHACIAYDNLMSTAELKDKFATMSHQRFLMHLMTQLIAIFKSNNVLLREWESSDIGTMINTDGFVNFGAALFNIGCYFNHSCLPNVIKVANEKYSITKTIRSIKAGEHLCFKYHVSSRRPTRERREFLLKACQFFCNCELCLSNGPTMIKDPVLESAFRVLAVHTTKLMFNKNIAPKELEKAKKKCYEFLAKFRNMPTSESIIIAYEKLKMIYLNELQNMLE